MSNGSVLVVGGEVGSNGAPEPTLEILPTPEGGPTYKFLDYLNRTDPNNLYPFLLMLPSSRVFIGAFLPRKLHCRTANNVRQGITMRLGFWTRSRWTPIKFCQTSLDPSQAS